jgi:hypothetical protein
MLVVKLQVILHYENREECRFEKSKMKTGKNVVLRKRK